MQEQLFGGGPVRAQLLQRDFAETLGQRLHVSRQATECRRTLVTAFVHIKGAVDLELDSMQARGRIAVVLGDKAAGIGLIAATVYPSYRRVFSTVSATAPTQLVP